MQARSAAESPARERPGARETPPFAIRQAKKVMKILKYLKEKVKLHIVMLLI